MRVTKAPLKAWKFDRSPRQCSGFEAASPLNVCVVIGPFMGWKLRPSGEVAESRKSVSNGAGWVGIVSITPVGSPRSLAMPSVSPSTWQDAQLMAPAPLRRAS